MYSGDLLDRLKDLAEEYSGAPSSAEMADRLYFDLCQLISEFEDEED